MNFSVLAARNLNFKGLYEKREPIYKARGHANINKEVYKINNSVYHPYEYETKSAINKAVKSETDGYTFSLWEKDHGQLEGDYYFINCVKVGTPIKKSDENKYIEMGYDKFPNSNTNEEEIYAAFDNEAYGVMDFKKLDADVAVKLAKEVKD